MHTGKRRDGLWKLGEKERDEGMCARGGEECIAEHGRGRETAHIRTGEGTKACAAYFTLVTVSFH